MSQEPALTIGTGAAAIVAIASLFNVVIDLDTVQTILVAAVPFVASFLIRAKVTPA